MSPKPQQTYPFPIVFLSLPPKPKVSLKRYTEDHLDEFLHDVKNLDYTEKYQHQHHDPDLSSDDDDNDDNHILDQFQHQYIEKNYWQY